MPMSQAFWKRQCSTSNLREQHPDAGDRQRSARNGWQRPTVSGGQRLSVAAFGAALTLLGCQSKTADSARLTVKAAQSTVKTGQSASEVGAHSTAATAAKAATAKPSTESQKPMSRSPLELKVLTISGKEKALADYKGKALLIVNTASECGFTPQYAGLQALYEKYQPQGLEVLGFPSNDFGGQEPGSCEQIDSFVKDKYQVTFPMFDKVRAKGPDKAPLYAALTDNSGEGISGEVEWNFTKFLVDRTGKVVARFEPSVDPQAPELIKKLEAALQ